MFCGHCGFKNEDGAVFCGNCGERLESSAVNPIPKIEKPVREEPVQEIVEEKVSEIPIPTAPKIERPVQKTPVKEEPEETIPEASARKKKGHLGCILFLIFCFLLLLGAGGVWGYFRFFRKQTLPLDAYLKVKFTGPSGYAKAGAELDWDAIEADYGKKLHFTSEAKEDGIARKYATPIDYLKEAVSAPSFDEDSDIEDGESIGYKWSVDEEEVADYLNCKIKVKDQKVKAHIKEKAEEKDLLEEITVETKGTVNGSGYLVLSDFPEGLSEEDFTIEPDAGLKNGDRVEISLAKDSAYYMEKCGFLPSKKKRTYTVSGLQEESAAPQSPTESIENGFGNAGEAPSGTANSFRTDTVPEFLCPYSSNRLITRQDVESLMTQYPATMFPGQRNITQMVVNEMYARYGYAFKDQGLTDYFSQFSWYANNWNKTSDMDSIYPRMSQIEKQNIDFLKTFH